MVAALTTRDHVAEILVARAQRSPSKTAFVADDDALTYAELLERAASYAAALRGQGVTRGDRVAVAMRPGLRLIEVFWALQLLGAVPCVLNPFVPLPTLQRRIELIRPVLIVTDDLVDGLTLRPAEVGEIGGSPDDLAVLQLTSGTTGAPRAGMVLHRNACAWLRSDRACRLRLDERDVAVSWAPPWHDMGLFGMVMVPVNLGATCHIVEPAVRTIPKWLQTFGAVGGTFSAAPDFAYRVAARVVDPASVDLRAVEKLYSGAEPVRAATITAFGERFATAGPLRPSYGLGEAVLTVTCHLPGEEVVVDAQGNVSCGFPNPGLEVVAGASVDDPQEIRVAGAPIFAGYFDAPEETAAALQDGWLRTGDVGYRDAEGRLFVLGRRSTMLKRAGGSVSPRELEEAAERVPQVKAAQAVGIDREGRDEEIVVAVTCDGDGQGVRAAVSAEIRATLGFAPSRVEILPRLPRTENGKLRYAELRDLVSGVSPS